MKKNALNIETGKRLWNNDKWICLNLVIQHSIFKIIFHRTSYCLVQQNCYFISYIFHFFSSRNTKAKYASLLVRPSDIPIQLPKYAKRENRRRKKNSKQKHQIQIAHTHSYHFKYEWLKTDAKYESFTNLKGILFALHPRIFRNGIERF